MAEELTVSVLITRSGESDLQLNDGTTYQVGSIGAGAVAWRKETATSPFVHGRVAVHAVRDAVESQLGVWVSGGTASALDTNIGTLITAFQQLSYDLTIVVDGVTRTWECESADYEIGFRKEMLSALYVPVELSFYRQPDPSTGTF